MAEAILAPESISETTKIVAGEITMDGTAPTSVSVVGKMSTIVGVQLTLKGTAAPALKESMATYDVDAATPLVVDIYPWMPSGAGDATLITGTTATLVVSYMIVGR